MYEKNRLNEICSNSLDPDSVVFFQLSDFIPKIHYEAVLDYGAGNAPYKSHISFGQYFTADISQNVTNTVNYMVDRDGRLAIPDSSFDLILLLDVLEHIPNPKPVLFELKRLLKPDGSLIISVPFLYREHETPFDYMRYTSFGAIKLLEDVGLRVSRLEKIGNTLYTLLTLMLERYIENGECVKISYSGKILNIILLWSFKLFRKALSKKPHKTAGVYHHLFIEARL